MDDRGRFHMATERVAIIALVLLTVLGVTEWPAMANGRLSFEDWLAAQSTRCKDFDGDGTPCELYQDQYIPAHRSYLSFTAPAQDRAAVVDWLGISGVYLRDVCGVDLGTTTTGSVTARNVKDGQVLVSVQGHTRNAIAFVVEDPTLNSFSPAIVFGAREADVCSGAAPSLVDVTFSIDYYTDAAHPIVDNQYFGNPPSAGGFPDDDFTFRLLMLQVHGEGTLVDGSPARLIINQRGIFQNHRKDSSFDGFAVEFIDLHPVGR